MIGPIIESRAVDMSFSTRKGPLTALDNFQLMVQPSEVLSIVGASGCGKSTFLNMVAGFLRPTRGEVLLEGQPIDGVESRCGMIFQSYALFPWMTVLESAGFGSRRYGRAYPASSV